MKRENYISSNPLLKLGSSLYISAMGTWPCDILSGQRLMNQKCPCYRALPDIRSGREVRQFFKIQTVQKLDVFLPGRRTFNTFKNRKKIQKNILFFLKILFSRFLLNYLLLSTNLCPGTLSYEN